MLKQTVHRDQRALYGQINKLQYQTKEAILKVSVDTIDKK
jgi:hypothetical protein